MVYGEFYPQCTNDSMFLMDYEETVVALTKDYCAFFHHNAIFLCFIWSQEHGAAQAFGCFERKGDDDVPAQSMRMKQSHSS